MDQIALSTNLANAIAVHLRHGGTRLESDMLADRLQDEANAPAREEQTRAQWQAMLDAKVAEVQVAADARVAEVEANATKDLTGNTGIVTFNQVGDNALPSGAVIVTREELNDPNGVDRPGVRIPPRKRGKAA